MIGVASTVFDVNGARIFKPGDPAREADNRKGGRRVTRTATLDGGVAVSDMGFSDGDRDINVIEDGASADAVDYAEYICRNYTSVTVSTPDGAYEAVPDTFSVDNGTLTLKMLVKQRISE